MTETLPDVSRMRGEVPEEVKPDNIATGEAEVVTIEGDIPKLAPPDEEPKEEEEELKITRVPSSVSTIAEMYKACFDDFAAQPAEVMKLLNIKANSDIIETPWDCYVTVFRKSPKIAPKKAEGAND